MTVLKEQGCDRDLHTDKLQNSSSKGDRNDSANASYESCIIISNVDSQEQLDDVRTTLITSSQVKNLDVDKIVVLGNLWSDAAHVTCIEYLTTLYRQHSLHNNERQMLISYEDSLIVLQLCLAEIKKEKIGDYDISTSKVIELHRFLVRRKLQTSIRETNDSDCEQDQVCEKYQEFLKNCNLFDWMDLIKAVSNELSNNEALQKAITNTSFLIANPSSNPIEHQAVKLLAKEKPCFYTTFETSLDDSLLDAATIHLNACTLSERLANATGRILATPGSQASTSQTYVEKVLMSYLHLLVNTRNELALANIFNVPERKLDHDSFTALKREAKLKKLSMYQTASSFVMRIRLGYRFDAEAVLSQHVKGISELMDLTHKLMTILEEDINQRSAMKRILNVIKNTIIKCRDEKLRKESVQTVTEKLQRLATHTLDLQETAKQSSPERDSHNGGSLVGRQTLRAIRAMEDKMASRVTSQSHADILTDNYSSQRTPITFPSMLSKFRSPTESSPNSKESQSLAERMKLQFDRTPKRSAVPRFQAHMDWAMPPHHVGVNVHREEPTIDNYIPSKTLVSAGCEAGTGKPRAFSARKVLDTINDQENTNRQLVKQTIKPCDESKEIGKTNSNGSKKRKSADNLASENKKPKKTSVPKNSKKKAIPLSKGQKQLTAFFRM